MSAPPTGRGVVHVFGLGPGGEDLVTAGTAQGIAGLGEVRLRTHRHPAAAAYGHLDSFDSLYDAAEEISDVYEGIAEQMASLAADCGAVGYVVPGSPVVAERSVELLLARDDVEVLVHPAMSFLDLTWVRLGVDPVETGVRLVDGHRFGDEARGQRAPLLVAQCDHRFVLSDVKLSVEDPPDVAVALLHHLGLPDEQVVEVDWSDMDRVLEPDHLTSLWIPELPGAVGGELARLGALMHRLRVEDPWKASQTHHSLKRYLLEESYEVLEAIDAYDPATGDGSEELCGELGDLLYQVVFHAELGAEAGWFTVDDVAAAIHDKLVRRHGHVVDPVDGAAPPELDDLVRAWEADKRTELGRSSVYDGIPAELPALARAAKVLRKSDPTPDVPTGDGPGSQDGPETPAALGARLWDVVADAHAAGVDPEDALRREVDRRIADLRAAEPD